MKYYSLERGPQGIYSLRPQKWEERHQTLLIVVAVILFAVSYVMAGTDEFNTMQADVKFHDESVTDSSR